MKRRASKRSAVARIVFLFDVNNTLLDNDRVKRWGTTVLLSDGDVVLQPHKVDRCRLNEAVQGHALIYVHKECELAAGHYPAICLYRKQERAAGLLFPDADTRGL